MPTLTYVPFCQYQLPMTALYCRTYRQYLPDELSDVGRAACQRRAFYASAPFRKTPHWTIADVGQQGAAAYRKPRRAMPARNGFEAMLLDAIRHMRRWSRYSDWSD